MKYQQQLNYYLLLLLHFTHAAAGDVVSLTRTKTYSRSKSLPPTTSTWESEPGSITTSLVQQTETPTTVFSSSDIISTITRATASSLFSTRIATSSAPVPTILSILRDDAGEVNNPSGQILAEKNAPETQRGLSQDVLIAGVLFGVLVICIVAGLVAYNRRVAKRNALNSFNSDLERSFSRWSSSSRYSGYSFSSRTSIGSSISDNSSFNPLSSSDSLVHPKSPNQMPQISVSFVDKDSTKLALQVSRVRNVSKYRSYNSMRGSLALPTSPLKESFSFDSLERQEEPEQDRPAVQKYSPEQKNRRMTYYGGSESSLLHPGTPPVNRTRLPRPISTLDAFPRYRQEKRNSYFVLIEPANPLKSMKPDICAPTSPSEKANHVSLLIVPDGNERTPMKVYSKRHSAVMPSSILIPASQGGAVSSQPSSRNHLRYSLQSSGSNKHDSTQQ